MKPADPLHLLKTLDRFHANVDSFLGLFLLGCIGHPFDHLIGHIHTRHTLLHVPGHPGRLKGRYTGQYRYLFMQTPVPDALHPFFEFVKIIDALGLDKLDSGGNFFCQPRYTDFKRIGKRIGGRTDKHPRGPAYVVTAQKLSFVAHAPDGLNQLH